MNLLGISHMKLFSSARALELALLCLVAATAHAQTGVIAGQVISLDGTAVAGAEVSVLPTGPHTQTDATGNFRLGGLASGRHTVLVRRPGFLPDTTPVMVPLGAPSITLFLSPVPTSLDTVRTDALAADLPRVVEREKEGISVVVTGATLMKEFPGFSEDAAIQFDSKLWTKLRGWSFCDDAIYIDGKAMPQSNWRDPSMPQPDFGIRDFIRMRDVAAVEVTRRIEDVHEPWIQALPTTGCAIAVLIWTKGFKQHAYKWPP